MNEKVNLQDLVSLLASKTDISKKEAEIFLKEYFSAITAGLLKDNSVKIKNLGSFKLTPVNNRESIDINQGTRVLIPAHYKVSYTPETRLAQDINHPFSWFEPVDLDEESISEDKTDEIIEEKPNPESVSVSREEKELHSETQKPIEAEIEQEKAPVPEKITEENKVENDDDYESLLKTIFWERYERAAQPHNRRKKNKKLFFKWISIFLLIIIFTGTYFYLERDKYFSFREPFISSVDDDFWNEYYTQKKENDSDLLPDTLITQEIDSVPNKKLETSEKITVPEDSVKKVPITPIVSNNENASIKRQEKNQEEVQTPQKKGKTRTVISGDRLTLIALEEYGHKAFWVYIYEENKNRIKDPNNLQVGTEITIPPGSKYKINKNDMESLQKANNLADKYAD